MSICSGSCHPASAAAVIPPLISWTSLFQVPPQSSAHPVRWQTASCKWSQTSKIAEIRCKFVCDGNYKAATLYQQDVQAWEKCQSVDSSTRVHSSQEHKHIFTGTYSNWNLWDIINLSTNKMWYHPGPLVGPHVWVENPAAARLMMKGEITLRKDW